MTKMRIITDSNSGISLEDAKKLDITILPMPFSINGEIHFEGKNLTYDDFMKKLVSDEEIKTSQPSPADVLELWDELLKEYDEILHIPMSAGLSGTCEVATLLARDYNDKVQIVNNLRISISQEVSVMDAVEMRDKGMSAAEIKEILEKESLEASIYLMVDTLKYLKKGGRITPAAAAIGTVLNLKPVLTIQGEKLDAFAKVRGTKAAKKTMLDAIEKDLDTRFKGKKMVLYGAYTCSDEEAKQWQQEMSARFPQFDAILMRNLSLSVCTHVGPGVLAIACMKRADF